MQLRLKLILVFFFCLQPQIAFSIVAGPIVWFDGKAGDGKPIREQRVIPNQNGITETYHFGFSETESSITIKKANGSYQLKHEAGRFSDDGKRYIRDYEKLNDFSLDKDRFEKQDACLRRHDGRGDVLFAD